MQKSKLVVSIIAVALLAVMASPCKAATVWSDDFNDGNYDGWTVTNGTFSAEDHTLRSIGGGGFIIYPSSVTTGTWSFDLLGVNNTMVGFISEYPVPLIPYPDSLALISYNPAIWIADRTAWSQGKVIATYDFPVGTSMTGWQHFDITLDSDGRVCVYHNGTLVMDKRLSPRPTVSEYFWVLLGVTGYAGVTGAGFSLNTEGAIDNIAVSNTVDIKPPTSVPFYMETWFLGTVGAVVAIVVVIIALLLSRKRPRSAPKP